MIAVDAVVQELKAQSKPVGSAEEIAQVIRFLMHDASHILKRQEKCKNYDLRRSGLILSNSMNK